MSKFGVSGENTVRGLIFNIQRFSLHDGPGIRTTVFTKGCPLHCKWCSNPESIEGYPEIMFYATRCINCGSCQKACSLGAIIRDEGDTKRIDKGKCNLCMDCVQACFSGALEQVGQYVSVEEVVQEVAKDIPFYKNSGGGMTISGGEPLLQWQFVQEVFKSCKERSVHTVLDTTGHTQWPVLDKVLEYVDLVLYDIKHMDDQMHRNGTGVTNELILANLPRVAKRVRTWIRVPVIPGFNDSEENIITLGKFASDLKIEKISLLPYHNWGEQKYCRLGLDYTLRETEPLHEEMLQNLRQLLEKQGLKVDVGK